MKLSFLPAPRPDGVSESDWMNWSWQLRNSLKSRADFERLFELSDSEFGGFAGADQAFQIRSTPYYASLAARDLPEDPIRKILMPTARELLPGAQQMLDPLGEKKNNPAPRIIHRYPDRLLFLVTDTCSVYCRYCTRKHFTGGDQAFVKSSEYDQALSYIKSKTGLREVILSGGDPLTLSDAMLERVLSDLRSIEHVEIIRIGTRMPVVCPMRITEELVAMIRKYHPVYVMTHFNHPRELTREAAQSLARMADHGIPVFNQLVLLNGVNNHPAIIQALSRRLLYLRTKPYYMFQCDPSEGTDHLRTSVGDSLEIQRELWGRLSGLAMPNLSLDIPDGGGKAGFTPNFLVSHEGRRRVFEGWDGVRSEYVDPDPADLRKPLDAELYLKEWEELKAAKL
jgi:lysine 2,3-aminomutase